MSQNPGGLVLQHEPQELGINASSPASPSRPSSAPAAPGPHATSEYDVDLRLDNLLALGEELCADSVALCDDEVTFTRREPAGVTRWRGVVGTRGLVRV